MKASLSFKGLDAWMEDLAAAGENVDDAVTELLTETQPFIAEELERNLQKTSETWTGETAASIDVSGVQKEGNYIFVEATAGGSDAPGAEYKEYGNTRQAAEPFFRPTFRGHLLKNKLKAGMKTIMEKAGLK
jgi:HK97 gp10 family phage protein